MVDCIRAKFKTRNGILQGLQSQEIDTIIVMILVSANNISAALSYLHLLSANGFTVLFREV